MACCVALQAAATHWTVKIRAFTAWSCALDTTAVAPTHRSQPAAIPGSIGSASANLCVKPCCGILVSTIRAAALSSFACPLLSSFKPIAREVVAQGALQSLGRYSCLSRRRPSNNPGSKLYSEKQVRASLPVYQVNSTNDSL